MNKAQKISQEQAEYNPTSDNEAKRCGTCRWFSPDADTDNRCQVVEGTPLEIVVGGISNRWETIDESEKRGDDDDDEYMAGRSIGAIKSLGDNRIGGYLVVWGSEKQKDLQDEYFTKETDLGLDLYTTRPVLYHHGLDKKVKATKVGDIDTLDPDDIGLWAEAQIAMHDEYNKHINELVNKGILKWSSGSLPNLVQMGEGGFIKAWPIVEGSLTPTPAEPRRTDVRPLKHVNISDELATTLAIEAKPREPDENASNPDNENKPKTTNNKRGNLMANATKQLSEEARTEIAEMIKQAIDAANAVAEEDTGAELPAEVQEEIAEVVAEGALEIIEEEIPEEATEAKAEGDDEEDDEDEAKKKSIRWVEKNLERVIGKAFDRYEQGKINSQKRAKTLGSRFAEVAKKNAPVENRKNKVGGYTGGNEMRISVMKEQKYAHATWQDMALYVKLKMATELRGLPEYMRRQVKLADLVGEEFTRNLMHKTALGLTATPLDDPVDRLAIKAQAPWMRAIKADELLSTAITNQTLEWVGTTFDADLWQRARHETRLFDLLSTKGMRIKDVDPGTNKVTFAIDTGSGTVFTRGEPRSLDSTGGPEATVQVTAFTTDNITMTAKEHAIAYIPSNWAAEDTFVDVMQFIQFDMLQQLMESLESVLLNGDTETAANTNINLIDNTPATGLQTPDYIAWDGMRKNFIVTNTTKSRDAGGNLVIEDYINTRALFGTTVRNRKENMLTVIDFDTEVATRKTVQLLTADVAGGAPLATMYTGDLPQVLDGVDTYTSGLLALSNANGNISATSGNNTFGTIVVAYAPYIAYGRKRQVEVKQQEDILSGSLIIVSSVRHISAHRSADGSVGTINVGV